ncbi:MAG: glycosyltransferase family 2 protein [Cyclobacteriaceae bacterium]|nr:glycosyltransferase family 2 protein [Cyclobacteriaceae bacterium HetDA_MAG_MS6]
MSKVSIITINYNQTGVTLELLKSLHEQDAENLEIIVVDNGSDNNDYIRLKECYPHIKLIRSEHNLGFAGGNNLGFAHAIGEFCFFLNNDTIVPTNTISQLVTVLEDSSKTGIVCPLIAYHSHPELLQFAGYTEIDPATGRNKAIKHGQGFELSDHLYSTPYAHGAAMMVKRRVIDEVGLMPENFFLYYEELDWSAQIKKAGFDILVCHGCHILHKESMSVGKDSAFKVYFQTRNRILFMRRNYGLFHRLIFFAFFLTATLPKAIIKYMLAKRIEHLHGFLAALFWNLSHSTSSTTLGYKYNYLNE